MRITKHNIQNVSVKNQEPHVMGVKKGGIEFDLGVKNQKRTEKELKVK